jgi:chemotaxis protein CheX
MSAAVVGRAFLDQVIHIFDVMLGLPLVGGRPTVKRERTSGSMVTVCTQLTGDVSGLVALGLEPSVAFAIVNRLLNERRCQLGPDVTDAVGEVTNIVVGNARARLSQAGYPGLQASLPVVTYGRGQSLTFPEGSIPTQIPFTSGQGSLNLMLALVVSPAGSQDGAATAAAITTGRRLHETVTQMLRTSKTLPVGVNTESDAEANGVLLAMSDREMTLLVDPAIEQNRLTVHLRAPMPTTIQLDLAVASSRIVANLREVMGTYRQAS